MPKPSCHRATARPFWPSVGTCCCESGPCGCALEAGCLQGNFPVTPFHHRVIGTKPPGQGWIGRCAFLWVGPTGQCCCKPGLTAYSVTVTRRVRQETGAQCLVYEAVLTGSGFLTGAGVATVHLRERFYNTQTCEFDTERNQTFQVSVRCIASNLTAGVAAGLSSTPPANCDPQTQYGGWEGFSIAQHCDRYSASGVFHGVDPLSNFAGRVEINANASLTPVGCRTPACDNGACCYPQGGCAVRTRTVCEQTGGLWLGQGTLCGPGVCPAPLRPFGACCLPNGSCIIASAFNCQQAGGAYQGHNTICSPNPCPSPPTAACCLKDNTCVMATQSACTGQGGTWNPGLNCSQVVCAATPTGACCLPGGSCAQLTAANCSAQGGFYAGDNTNCGGLSCTGACCVAGVCHVQSPHWCQANAGNFLGLGTSCDPDPCGGVTNPEILSVGHFLSYLNSLAPPPRERITIATGAETLAYGSGGCGGCGGDGRL